MKLCIEVTRDSLNVRWRRSAAAAAAPAGPSRETLRQLIIAECGHFLKDFEWRYKQSRDLLDEVRDTLMVAPSGRDANVVPLRRQVTAEDINDTRHRLTGYTVTNNSPGAGSIAWAGLHIVYGGVDYTIADGNTALKFTYFVKPGSGTTATLVSSNTKPTLGPDDLLVFLNVGGTATVTATDGAASLPRVIGDNTVDSGAIVGGAVTTAALALNAVDSTRLADGAVSTSAKLASGIVGTTQLASNAVDSTKLADGAVSTSAKLGSGIVGTTQLANSAVDSTKLAGGAVSPTKLNILAHVLY